MGFFPTLLADKRYGEFERTPAALRQSHQYWWEAFAQAH